MQEAVIAGFAQPGARARWWRRTCSATSHEVKDVWERRTSELAQNVVVGLFPTWGSTISQETLDAADAFLARRDAALPHCAGW